MWSISWYSSFGNRDPNEFIMMMYAIVERMGVGGKCGSDNSVTFPLESDTFVEKWNFSLKVTFHFINYKLQLEISIFVQTMTVASLSTSHDGSIYLRNTISSFKICIQAIIFNCKYVCNYETLTIHIPHNAITNCWNGLYPYYIRMWRFHEYILSPVV